MAIIHDTTMTPGKLELLAAWLPAQPWYQNRGRAPELARAGGFRLDDPMGEVGIEFMVVTDGSGGEVTAYLVPMTYRARARPGADGALIGTSEHGILGLRWIYDGPRDPVLMAQLTALFQGTAEPQAQSASHTPDPTVVVEPVLDGARGQLQVQVNRVLRPARDAVPPGRAGQAALSGPWRPPDGTQVRGVLATARAEPP